MLARGRTTLFGMNEVCRPLRLGVSQIGEAWQYGDDEYCPATRCLFKAQGLKIKGALTIIPHMDIEDSCLRSDISTQQETITDDLGTLIPTMAVTRVQGAI